MTLHKSTNINLVWGELLIEELARLGITDICIAPGSRSTPLTLAAADNSAITCHCHFDERGLAFYALGLAKAFTADISNANISNTKAKAKAVAIITTSGTAVANLHPALIEAKQQNIPLLVLSADRPEELINCGANQAITQQDIFANAVCYQANIPAPSFEVAPEFLLTSVDIAAEKMQQHSEPVQLNCMFREPFYPSPDTNQNMQATIKHYLSSLTSWQQSTEPYTSYYPSNTQCSPLAEHSNITDLADKKVVVIVSQLTADNAASTKENTKTIVSWAQQNGFVLLLDCQSSARHDSNKSKANNNTGHQSAINYYDQLLHNAEFKAELARCDYIIQFGVRPISKRLSQFIADTPTPYWLIDASNERHDPSHRVSKRFVMSATTWLKLAADSSAADSNAAYLNTANSNEERPKTAESNLWLAKLKQFDKQASQLLTQVDKNSTALSKPSDLSDLSEYSAIRQLAQLLPENSQLFLGNSMPVRLFDMFAMPKNNGVDVFTNRGASGIDGLLATSIGVSVGTAITKSLATDFNANTLTLVIGDTSLLHDLNSLALVNSLRQSLACKQQINLIIVALNNDGGAIFNMLPVPEKNHVKQNFYQMPHGLQFEHAARMFGLEYYAPTTLAQFSEHYQSCLAGIDKEAGEKTALKASLIEVIVPPEQTTNLVKAIGQRFSCLDIQEP